jgi:hypothetical protein
MAEENTQATQEPKAVRRPSTQRERAAERRREKLEHVQAQIRDGLLTVRQATPEERARWASARTRRPAKRRAGTR